ncbi:MAG: PEP/pyruvate-binding domain-containing protein, partial [bacterium]
MFLFDKKRKKETQKVANLFKSKYAYFKALLDSNSELLTLVADMEVKLVGETAFGMSYLRSLVTRIAFHAARMVKSINKMSNDRYTILGKIFENLIIRINLLVEPEKSRSEAPLILFYGDITRSLADIVGGKNANLGEILQISGMSIPRGFAITTAGYEAFVASNNLLPEIKKARLALDPDDFSSFVTVGSKIESLFRAGKVPVEVEAAIREACRTVVSQCGKPVTWALRSSAIGEDGDLSFAGQYRTVLNVSSNNVFEEYKEVLAGLCTPSALSYRLNMGVPFEDFAMSVACLEMISARASGVVYSRNPIDPKDDRVIINGVWGLGLPVVDGKMTPDIFRLSRRNRHDPVETEITRKEVRLTSDGAGSLVESPVMREAQTMPCLSAEQARSLASYALTLEEHFGRPQDVEWVVDEEGRIVLLQTRPLRVVDMSTGMRTTLPLISGYPLLLQGGEIAFPGVGSGKVFHVKSDQDLTAFPDDAVLVAEHSSPKYGMVLRKAKAVVTNLGSNTGHMAALVREFKVPCLLNTGDATRKLISGQLVTVDSISRRVYQGEVKELGAFVPK